MSRYLLVFALFTVLLFAACEESDVDITPPGMRILSTTPSFSTHTICGTTEDSVLLLQGGEAIDFSVSFEDDKALSQYKIDIHNNFDCHGHGGGATPGVSVPDVVNQTTDWSVLDIVALSGQQSQIDFNLPVPANVTAGNYHFQIQVLDESGNDNPLANFYSLSIKNPKDAVAPILSTTQPTGAVAIRKGESLNFKGSVSDNYSLSEGGNGLLFLTYTDLSSGNTFTTDAVFPFDSSVSTTYDFDFDYTVPTTLVAGDYLFTLRIHDGVRNVGEAVEFDVAVEN
jgi:hypothetical protein